MQKTSARFKFHFGKILVGYDRSLILVVIGLTVFGLIAIYNASSVLALRDFGDQYRFVLDQSKYLVLGLFLMLLVSTFDYHRLYKLSIPLLFLTLLLLVAVFIPGIGIHVLGAKRWLNLGFFVLQPTELTKLVLVIYLSAWFTYKERKRFLPFLVLLSIILGLVILQPDLGTAVIISAIAAILYFISGAPLLHFLTLLPLGLGAVAVLAVAAPYRLARIATFFDPNQDPLGKSYHIRQVLIALGSGGLFGLGLGKSRQKYEYLPESTTDSIFAIIAEEIGFVGSLLIILLFAYIVYRAFLISRKAPDRFGQLLAAGIAVWFGIQCLINLSAMVALIPLTGVPLPFVSYGGSNLVSLLIGFGILLNIGRQGKR